MRNEIREANLEDVEYISLHLREADKEEIYASCGNRLYRDMLQKSYENSKKCYTWLIDGKPCLIGGVVHSDVGGIVWAMGTDEILTEKKFFFESAYKYIALTLEDYSLIYNYVHAGNTVHINWLRGVGFHVNEKPTKLKNGSEFYYFQMER